jgi:hypothetical protein
MRVMFSPGLVIDQPNISCPPLATGFSADGQNEVPAHRLPASLRCGGLTGSSARRVVAGMWLRHLVKWFLRWRISTGKSYHQINRDITALQRLADAFAAQTGPDAQSGYFTRATIENFLSLLVERGLGASSRGTTSARSGRSYARPASRNGRRCWQSRPMCSPATTLAAYRPRRERFLSSSWPRSRAPASQELLTPPDRVF